MLANPNSREQARAFVGLILIAEAISTCFGLGYAAAGEWLLLGNTLLVMAAFAPAPFLLRAGIPYRGVVYYALTVGCAAQFVALLQSGGLHSPSLVWILAIPIFSAMLAGLHGAIFAAALALTELTALWVLEATGIVDMQAAIPDHPETLRLVSFFTAIIMTSSVSGYYFLSRVRLTRQLLEMNTQRNNLVSIVCHDISNPLAVISASMDLIEPKLDHASNPRLQRLFTRSRGAVEHIQSIVRDVRSLNEVIVFGWGMNPEPVNIGDVLTRSIQDLSLAAEQKGIMVRTDIAGDLPFVLARAGALRSNVFNNILSNAIKFSERGAEVHIRARAAGDKVIVEVEDFGRGIPPEFRDSLFDQGTKTSETGTDGERGTGFGLPIAKQVLDLFEASIAIETRYGDQESQTGTTFCITFSTTMGNRKAAA